MILLSHSSFFQEKSVVLKQKEELDEHFFGPRSNIHIFFIFSIFSAMKNNTNFFCTRGSTRSPNNSKFGISERMSWKSQTLKFVYTEKATKLCEITTLLWSTVHTDKSKVEILAKFCGLLRIGI